MYTGLNVEYPLFT